MTVHIVAFIFYTLAMLGVIFIAFFVYKKVVLEQGSGHVSKLKVEDMLRLNQRKTLYVINYEGEKFLIAGDVDSTTLISKLNLNSKIQKVVPDNKEVFQTEQKEPEPVSLEEKYLELKHSGANSKDVMRSILKEINSKKERF